MTAIFLIGAVVTAIAYPVLFARRHPGQPRWIVIGVVVGLAAMLLWPVTLWVAAAMWLTGFTRRSSFTGWRRRRVVLPLAAVGSLATFLVMSAIIGPRPAPTPTTPAAVADIVTSTTPAPTTTTAPTTTPLPPTPAPLATTTTTTRPPVATTTPSPEPQPRPAPRPAPRPDPEPEPDTGRRTGNTGHPCLPGERDGDNDGYCGEGR